MSRWCRSCPTLCWGCCCCFSCLCCARCYRRSSSCCCCCCRCCCGGGDGGGHRHCCCCCCPCHRRCPRLRPRMSLLSVSLILVGRWQLLLVILDLGVVAAAFAVSCGCCCCGCCYFCCQMHLFLLSVDQLLTLLSQKLRKISKRCEGLFDGAGVSC